jgi:hypothetical protein
MPAIKPAGFGATQAKKERRAKTWCFIGERGHDPEGLGAIVPLRGGAET